MSPLSLRPLGLLSLVLVVGSFNTDPETDRPAVLREYADSIHVRWPTGNSQVVRGPHRSGRAVVVREFS